MDDQLFISYPFYFQENTDSLCGEPDKDLRQNFRFTIPHASHTLNLKLEWNPAGSPTNILGGVREISVLALEETIYDLNGKPTSYCPFYAPPNETSLSCEDPLFSDPESNARV